MSNFTDVIAERGILSIFCNNPKLVLENSGILNKDDLSTDTNKIIYDSLLAAVDQDPDNVDRFIIRNIAIELGYHDYDQLTDHNQYVEALFLQKINPKNLTKCIKRVKDLSVKRKSLALINELHEFISDSEEDNKSAIEVVSCLENKVADLTNSIDRRNDIVLLGRDFLELVNERADNPQPVGLSSGLQRYDLAIGGGFRRGSVSLIGARAKNFKSGFALNIAISLGQSDKSIPVLILDTELQEEYQKFRFGAASSRVPIDLLETGLWRNNKNVVEAVNAADKKMDRSLIYHIYVGGMRIEQIISSTRYWLSKFVGRNDKGQFNDCLVVYDYVKVMDHREIKADLAEWQVLGFHMSSLHDFVTRHNIPMLCMCQLNRDGSDTDDDTVFAGDDRLIWFTSNYSILRHKFKEELEEDGPNAGNMRLKIIGTRHGPGMAKDDYLNLRVNHACMFVEEGKLKSELITNGEVGRKEADELDDEENDE